MRSPQLIILAGPNGAGKTTYQNSQAALRRLPFINADVIALEVLGRQPQNAEEMGQAQITARNTFQEFLETSKSFCFETVFSHESKIIQIKEAIEKRYSVHLIIVCNDNLEVNVARVKQRVIEGGHDVPENKIKDRRPRTLANLSEAINLVSSFIFIDSTNLKPDGMKWTL